MIYDAIVVGAGPAGAVLAYLLANSGLKVLVLEKATLPRYKTCGGGVTYKTVQSLPVDASSTYEREAIGGIVSYTGKQLLKANVKGSIGWLVMRDRFDYLLAQCAVNAGAELFEGVTVERVEQEADRVKVQTSKGEFTARFVVGADGVLSTVARLAGLLRQRQVGVAIEAEIEVPTYSLEAQGPYATFDFGALPGGYGWIFPKLDHLSVGVFRALPGKAAGLGSHLDRFITSHAVLDKGRRRICQGHLIPLGGRMETLHQGMILLVGDAANLADPWLGEGLCYAVRSARIAAETIQNALALGLTDLSAYTRRVNVEIVQQLSHARRLAGLIYRFPGLGSQLISKSLRMQELVFGNLRGDLTFRQLNRKLFLETPTIFFQALSREKGTL